ncbi:MAG: tetratricopeptide repeat protein [Burkholderiaceae bacterium]|uniref:SirB1 family protein n=1 Tax=Ottowia sp. TaxID=1898956 RepID=UPI001DD99DC5|nr:tetratricopeptide repeat protein [Ottowia sp.]MCP5258071.1 tetratricopeptide repeat protein [Burkholderiaceae bacterium]MCB2025519.1 tetratricopeptide repeat protein [Ottowia sp.]MCB2032352.1 tetratricopeptide repeat protein [Ottowia sp.]HPR45841.1 tetratricopeptide repeat protein [Ottowia sp.]HRW72333.1 tetratricopeptide repeat protein [Ottowia sp.]
MALTFRVPSSLEYFGNLVARDDELPLLEAAACLAQDEYPELDVEQVLADVDRLLERARRRAAVGAEPLERVQALGQFFFSDLGFGGNLNDYYNPDNSYLHRVLQTRRGIPISLALLWLELARGLGVEAEGISFPGHFLMRVNLDGGMLVLDPMNGQSLGRDDLRLRIEEWQPRLPAAPNGDLPLTAFLQACTPRQMLTRMLRNLQDIHRSQHDWPRLVAVQDRLIVLLPQAWEEYRERGLALAEQGERRRAAADLDRYLRERPAAQDHDAVAERRASLGD